MPRLLNLYLIYQKKKIGFSVDTLVLGFFWNIEAKIIKNIHIDLAWFFEDIHIGRKLVNKRNRGNSISKEWKTWIGNCICW